MDNLSLMLFAVLPYVAITTFVMGTVFRYYKQGYKVTSLSSQLFETRLLYWGSHAFHIGIVVLFVGHLIGFLLPSGLIVLGGKPARLIPIEIGAFGFALLSMFGLITLIFRRVVTVRLHKITSPMDIVVYILLGLQVITGMVTAVFFKWGSLWFASTLSPYLKSILLFSPDIKAVAEMPFFIKVHVALAFLIVGLIPFTRLMHMLVYPFVFIGRAAQVVIWNRDHKTARQIK